MISDKTLPQLSLQQKDVHLEQGNDCRLNVAVLPETKGNGQNIELSKTNPVEQKKPSQDYFWRFVTGILRLVSIVSHEN